VAPLPRLSVVMFTGGAAGVVARTLERVRPVAHEIVVAVDERVPLDHLGPLERVADQVVRAEFVYPLEANLRWLHGLATGDWVLRLDSDDVVSDGLLALLGTPGWDLGITHAYLQYRWLWGSPDQVLDQAPWWPDPVLRLIRNQPGLARFPHGAHEVAEVAGCSRLFDVGLYHLDLLLHDGPSRAAKATAYEHQNPGHRTDRGWSVSTTYYVPERMVPPPTTATVPPGDAAAIASVLAGLDADLAPASPALRDAAVVRAADRTNPPPDDRTVAVRVLDHEPIATVEGRSAVVSVGVRNIGDRTLDPDAEPADQVGGRFIDNGGFQTGFELRAPFPGPIPPGQETVVRLPLPAWAPDEALFVEAGVVQDGIGWHGSLARVRLARQRGRRILVRTGISTFPHLGDDLIAREVLGAVARHLPDVVPVMLAHPTAGIAERFGCDVATSPVALAPLRQRGAELGRRSRDLVNQARLLARGREPADPAVAEALEPFRTASALVLAPGGGLATRYSDEALLVCAVEALIARAFGLPVVIEGPSIGPIEMRRDQAAISGLINDAQHLTVRDHASLDAVKRIGRGVSAWEVPDPATAAVRHLGRGADDAAAWLGARGIDPTSPYAVLSLRASDLAAGVIAAEAALGALAPEVPVVFLPHVVDDDGDDVSAWRDAAWAGAVPTLADHALGTSGAVGLVAGARLAVGNRFHLSVLASAAGVRAVALVHDDYDRLRLRGLRRWSGLRMVEANEPDAAGAGAASLLAADDPEPGAAWDDGAFARNLAALLPVAPRLS
jgi:polysaccharide pyruvyl transferase WcaK-like protein